MPRPAAAPRGGRTLRARHGGRPHRRHPADSPARLRPALRPAFTPGSATGSRGPPGCRTPRPPSCRSTSRRPSRSCRWRSKGRKAQANARRRDRPHGGTSRAPRRRCCWTPSAPHHLPGPGPRRPGPGQPDLRRPVAPARRGRRAASAPSPGVPREGLPRREAELYDTSGGITLVFYGRRSIPGIEPGANMRAEGMVGETRATSPTPDPSYRLLPRERRGRRLRNLIRTTVSRASTASMPSPPSRRTGQPRSRQKARHRAYSFGSAYGAPGAAPTATSRYSGTGFTGPPPGCSPLDHREVGRPATRARRSPRAASRAWPPCSPARCAG